MHPSRLRHFPAIWSPILGPKWKTLEIPRKAIKTLIEFSALDWRVGGSIQNVFPPDRARKKTKTAWCERETVQKTEIKSKQSGRRSKIVFARFKNSETTEIVSPKRVWGGTAGTLSLFPFYFWFWWLSAPRSPIQARGEMRLFEALDFSLFSHFERENSVQCWVARFDCRARSTDDRDGHDENAVFWVSVSPSRFDTLESSISCAISCSAGGFASQIELLRFLCHFCGWKRSEHSQQHERRVMTKVEAGINRLSGVNRMSSLNNSLRCLGFLCELNLLLISC